MPFINVLMREMKKTGFIQNRGRMVVVYYLMQDSMGFHKKIKREAN